MTLFLKINLEVSDDRSKSFLSTSFPWRMKNIVFVGKWAPQVGRIASDKPFSSARRVPGAQRLRGGNKILQRRVQTL